VTLNIIFSVQIVNVFSQFKKNCCIVSPSVDDVVARVLITHLFQVVISSI
jgi:hypothetical protein